MSDKGHGDAYRGAGLTPDYSFPNPTRGALEELGLDAAAVERLELWVGYHLTDAGPRPSAGQTANDLRRFQSAMEKAGASLANGDAGVAHAAVDEVLRKTNPECLERLSLRFFRVIRDRLPFSESDQRPAMLEELRRAPLRPEALHAAGEACSIELQALSLRGGRPPRADLAFLARRVAEVLVEAGMEPRVPNATNLPKSPYVCALGVVLAAAGANVEPITLVRYAQQAAQHIKREA